MVAKKPDTFDISEPDHVLFIAHTRIKALCDHDVAPGLLRQRDQVLQDKLTQHGSFRKGVDRRSMTSKEVFWQVQSMSHDTMMRCISPGQ